MGTLGLKMFTADHRLHVLHAHNAAECARQGIRDPVTVKALEVKLCARMAPLLAENPDMPGHVVKDLLAARKLDVSEGAARHELIEELVSTKIYGTKKSDPLKLEQLNEYNKARPALNAELAKGGGYSVPVVRHVHEVVTKSLYRRALRKG